MSFKPVMDIDIGDHGSADPLNPTINYTHFHPSAEQRDPHIPLGFKIYGIGCLVAFIIFLILVIIYVINKQIKNWHKHGGKDANDGQQTVHQQKLDSLECGTSKDHGTETSPVSTISNCALPAPVVTRDKPRGILKTSPTYVPRT